MLDEIGEDTFRRKVFLRDFAGRPGVRRVVGIDAVDRIDDLLQIRESEQPAARGEDVAEAGVLSDYRPTGGQVLGAPLAEPAAAEAHVLVLGHCKFATGPGDVLAISVEIA